MFDRPETVRFYRRRLPHWEVADGRYFLTLRLQGAIPEVGHRRIRALRAQLDLAVANGQDELAQRRAVFAEMERWLDSTPRVDHLQHPGVARMVADAIQHRADSGVWTPISYVIMPNHLHLFVRLGSLQLGTHGYELDAVVKAFKRWTGHEAGKLLGVDVARFWQREWFDHWSRSALEDEKIARYIRANPVKAGLVPTPSQWLWQK